MYYIASLAKFDDRYSTVWAHRQDQWEGNNYSLSFRRIRGKIYAIFLQRIYGREFLSPRTTIFSGIENYPSASMSCCSDDLARLLPCLDLWSLRSEIVSVREKFFASICGKLSTLHPGEWLQGTTPRQPFPRLCSGLFCTYWNCQKELLVTKTQLCVLLIMKLWAWPYRY